MIFLGICFSISYLIAGILCTSVASHTHTKFAKLPTWMLVGNVLVWPLVVAGYLAWLLGGIVIRTFQFKGRNFINFLRGEG